MSRNRSYRTAAGLLLALLCTMLLACGSGDDGGSDGAAAGTPAASGPVTVKDATGATVTVNPPAKRVGVVYWPILDTMAELDIAPAVVFDDFSNYMSDEIKRIVYGKDTFGGKKLSSVPSWKFTDSGPDVESILAAQPDLLWAEAGNGASLKDSVGETPLYFQRQADWRSALQDTQLFGRFVGREEDTTRLTDEFNAWREATLAKLPKGERPTVAIISGSVKEPIVSTTKQVTASLLKDFVDMSAWTAGKTAFPNGNAPLSLERLLKVDPDYIFIGDGGAPDLKTIADPDALLKKNWNSDLFRRLTAVKEDRVTVFPELVWDVRGIRSLRLAAEGMLSVTDPDAFPKPAYLP